MTAETVAPVIAAAMKRSLVEHNAYHLISAAEALVEACGRADVMGDLSEEVDGSLMDDVRDALSDLRGSLSLPPTGAAAPAQTGEGEDDGLHKAIARLRAHVAAIQEGRKAAVTSGPMPGRNPIVACVNDLPAIIRELDAAELEIEAAFERYEDAALSPAPVGRDGWRPISEHDGSEGPYDLWRNDERLIDYRWRGRWEKVHGYPTVTTVLMTPPSHFMTVPLNPTEPAV